MKSTDTGPEVRLRRALWAEGYRYRLHARDLPGRPDLVFRGSKVAVFVDGDFWHGRVLREGHPTRFRASLGHRPDWWLEKISRNIRRDMDVNAQLEDLGWCIVRVWESTIKRDLPAAVERVSQAIEAAKRLSDLS